MECLETPTPLKKEVIWLSLGHTPYHFSLRFIYDGKNIVVAVTSLSYFLAGKPWAYNLDFESPQLAEHSFKKIISHAPVIIPGHGTLFFRK